MKRRGFFRGRYLLAAVAIPLAFLLVQSCSRKESASAPAASAEQPGKLADLLKKSGFAVPEKPFAAEDFTLGTVDGSQASLSSFRGKVVFLSFWATWCGPCKQELPSIEALYTKLSSRGLVVVAVDLGEDKAKVAQFVKTNKLTFPVLLDFHAAVGSAYQASSIPTNYLLDRSGHIIARIVGFDGTDWTSSGRLELFDKILSM
jgi:peroxiredoxin